MPDDSVDPSGVLKMAASRDELMATVRALCSAVDGQGLRISFKCRTDGPLLLEVRVRGQPGIGRIPSELTAAFTGLRGVLRDCDRVMALIDLPADFGCPRRAADGSVLAGWCYDCRYDG